MYKSDGSEALGKRKAEAGSTVLVNIRSIISVGRLGDLNLPTLR